MRPQIVGSVGRVCWQYEPRKQHEAALKRPTMSHIRFGRPNVRADSRETGLSSPGAIWEAGIPGVGGTNNGDEGTLITVLRCILCCRGRKQGACRRVPGSAQSPASVYCGDVDLLDLMLLVPNIHHENSCLFHGLWAPHRLYKSTFSYS